MSTGNTGPITDPPPSGPGRISDRALIRVFTALPWLGAVAIAAAWLAGR